MLSTQGRSAARRIVSIGLMATFVAPAVAQIDQQLADTYFEEVAALCEQEGDERWGVSLCGPIVIADPVTGEIATNQPAPDAPRPKVLGYANTALEWGDMRWSTLVWQMIPKDDRHARVRLMLHELFHRVQPQLGLYVMTSEGTPDHLDELDGRYWMQLEWRALAKALGSSGEDRLAAISDALAFREKRRSLYPGAAERERVIEVVEGLAQYSGTVAALSSREEAVEDAISQLERAPSQQSFVRTFAYPSGAAYGLLLDEMLPGWTRRFEANDDFGRLVQSAASIQTSDDLEAAARRYGGPELWAEEEERERERQIRIAELRERFVAGPVLVLPRGRNASFVTTGLTPIPGEGTIYPTFRVSGEWGSLEADQVLMSEDGSTLTVPAPATTEGDTLWGEGWKVTLAPGWGVRSAARAGDFQVVRVDR